MASTHSDLHELAQSDATTLPSFATSYVSDISSAVSLSEQNNNHVALLDAPPIVIQGDSNAQHQEVRHDEDIIMASIAESNSSLRESYCPPESRPGAGEEDGTEGNRNIEHIEPVIIRGDVPMTELRAAATAPFPRQPIPEQEECDREIEDDSVGRYIDEYGHWPFSDEDDQIRMEEEADEEFYKSSRRMPSGLSLLRAGTPFASAFGHILTRKRMRSSFYATFEKARYLYPASTLFNRNGSLRQEYISHPIKKGTGKFDQELARADILFVDEIYADEIRKGHGTFVLQKLIEKARELAHVDFILVHAVLPPSLCPVQMHQEQLAQTNLVLQKFFSHNSFSRVGNSDWFCLACDREHRSRLAYNSDDSDFPLKLNVDSYGNSLPAPRSDEFKDRYPAHAALVTVAKDEECIEHLQLLAKQYPNHRAWYTYVYEGNSLLHLAAIHQKPKCTQWLLLACPDLNAFRNYAGETPLEALEAILERDRSWYHNGEVTAKASGNWAGHSELATHTIMALEGIEPNDEKSKERIRRGCTCRNCTLGSVSPRMLRLLYHYANIISMQLAEGAQDMNDRFWKNAKLWYYIPKDIRDTMPTNKDQRRGFAQLCHIVAVSLELERKPTLETLKEINANEEKFPDYMTTYLETGGTIDSAIHMIVDRAEESDYKYYSSDRTFDKFLHSPDSELYEDLKPCRNDEEFDYARRGLVDSRRPDVPCRILFPQERVDYFSRPPLTYNAVTGYRGPPILRNPFQDIYDEAAVLSQEERDDDLRD
ncbi:MAG: hypothetical protein MMC23_000048 [Stictis urceolatum]|nr:hypothetical protein [Stictis urceolata]